MSSTGLHLANAVSNEDVTVEADTYVAIATKLAAKNVVKMMVGTPLTLDAMPQILAHACHAIEAQPESGKMSSCDKKQAALGVLRTLMTLSGVSQEDISESSGVASTCVDVLICVAKGDFQLQKIPTCLTRYFGRRIKGKND
jgi:hypothetical protein